MKTKSIAASNAGRERWRNVSTDARKNHATLTVLAREQKRANEQAEVRRRARSATVLKEAFKAASRENPRELLYDCLGFRKINYGRIHYCFGYKLGAKHSDELHVNRAKLAAWNGLSPSKTLKAIFDDGAVVLLQVAMKQRGAFLRGLRDGAAGSAESYVSDTRASLIRRNAWPPSGRPSS